jgi:hypothetical protein
VGTELSFISVDPVERVQEWQSVPRAYQIKIEMGIIRGRGFTRYALKINIVSNFTPFVPAFSFSNQS